MKLKFVTSFLLLSFLLNYGQSNEELKIKELHWGSNDSQKNNIDVPAKWENESAVVLYQDYFYDYHKFAKNVRYTHSIRKRVKLLDKASVDEYSEFSFVKKFRVRRGYYGRKGKKYMGIKIIKPDGSEKEIEIDKEAVETDEKNEYKIAISGLEVGDIIDYYSHSIEPFKQKYGYSFSPITRPLNDVYPTKEFVLRFNTENDFFINFNTYNGAPKLKEIETGKANDRRYILKASDIEKSDFPAWYYYLNELPYFKFQVTFARSGKFEDHIFNFLSDKEKDLKTVVSPEDVLELYRDDYGKFKHDLKGLKKHFKGKKLSKEKLVEKGYYYLRHFYRMQYIQPSVIREAGINYNAFSYYLDDHFFLSKEGRFLSGFGNFLINNKIPFDVIVAESRANGNINDLLFTDDITSLIRVNLKQPIYISLFDDNTNLTTINPYIENSKAYALAYSYDDKRLSKVSEITIPMSSYNENASIEKAEVSLTEDFTSFKVSKTSTYKGHSKSQRQEDLLNFYDYIGEDSKKHGTESFFVRVRNKKNKLKYKKEYDALVEKLKTKQDDYYLESLKREYELNIEDQSFTIKNTGRYEDNPDFIVDQNFTIKDELIKKAGKNYIIEVGKLIGDQVEFTGKERERTENIYINYPKSFDNTVKFTIPDGYSVSGLDKLSKSIDNEAGSFESTAKVENNILVLTTLKKYKTNYQPNSNWNLVLEFIDAANQFTNEKILLKKK